MTEKGVVNIHGSDYRTVALRVSEFREDHVTWTIDTELVHADDNRVIVRAEIRDTEGRVISAGMAEEQRGSNNINQTSALENCETSAVGRALAFYLYAGDEIASADEVAQAINQQNAGGRADSPSSQSQPDSQDSQGSPPSGESAPRTATDKQLKRLKQLEAALWVVEGKVERPKSDEAREVLENSVLSDLEEGAGKPPGEWPQGAVGQRIGKLKQKDEVISVFEDIYPEVDTSDW